MIFSRLGPLVVPALVVAFSASAQTNAAKPVLSVPPAARTPTDSMTPATQQPVGPAPGQTPSQVPGQSSGQIPGQSSGQVPGQSDAPAAVSLPTTGSADVPPTYVIGPDDSIVVNVWKEQGLSGTLPVRPDGMISLPLVGDLQAAGFTPMQLAQDIAAKLKKYVNDPNVTVTVTGVNSKRIYMLGEIGHMGPLPLTAGLTPLDAIATAGGPSPYANAKKIYILRSVNGKQVRIPFDYKKALKTGDQQGVTLMPGDKIVVP